MPSLSIFMFGTVTVGLFLFVSKLIHDMYSKNNILAATQPATAASPRTTIFKPHVPRLNIPKPKPTDVDVFSATSSFDDADHKPDLPTPKSP